MALPPLTKLRNFVRASGGNVGPVFALATIPAFTMVGGAIDFARAHSYQTFLQTLLDAATTASAREYANTGNATTAENRLRDVVLAGLTQHSGGRVTFQCWIDPQSKEKDYDYIVTLTTSGTQPTSSTTCSSTPPASIPPDSVVLKNGSFSTSSSSINPTLSSAVSTTSLSLARIQYIRVSAASQASLSGKKLEVAMMLDTTGSMADSAGSMSKLAAMKSAANDMLNILTPSLNAGNTRIAVVPFAEGVNVGSYGTSIWGANPAATSGYSVTTTNRYGQQSTRTYSWLKTACVSERYTSSAMTDNPPASGDYFTPLYNSVGARAELSSMIPMTSTLATLQNKVNGLTANGSTPGHIGTQWAWNMLSPKWAGVWGTASAPAAYDDKTVMKVAILMTDGEYNLQFCKGVDDNSMNCSDPNGTSTNQARAFCESMKAQGITVYTIGFQINVQSARDTLVQCASYSKSDPTKKLYYFPYSSDDIKAAFADIGNQLKAGQSGVMLGQ